ncbi:MAG: helix-turn-helix domain-containing protein [Anaerolineales bacterium]|nr:helix-turn-helix domain-containing protein [Anaerolineales bacterium]MCX7608579.1 helix-turn-helix domain-containing protein [Anaerolineales bacterium]MDW8226413.1 helix-turn-helix transcriptional regulator [Anaerolineales bacterium]
MSIQSQIAIRSKSLGVLIRDARIFRRKTIPECAALLGVSPSTLRAWEEGRKAPSLPELEVLAYALELPISHFWSKDIRSDDANATETLNLPLLINLRHRVVGALLRKAREAASLSLRILAEQTGFPISRLRAYELGERPIPLPELEVLAQLLNTRIETFFDTSGPVGRWMMHQKSINAFLQLPDEMQEFVTKPVNRPYLELAMKLSNLSAERLRSLAETLLDITF